MFASSNLKEIHMPNNSDKPVDNDSKNSSNNPSSTRAPLSPNKWTTIRTWKMTRRVDGAMHHTDNPKEVHKSHGNYGHATVETNNFYASFWPAVHFNPNLKTPVSATHASSPQEDTYQERRKYDGKFTLYSLDEDKINAEFERFEKERNTQSSLVKESGWSAKGRKTLNQYRGENCSGLAYRLLKAGGINELSDKCKKLDSKFLTVTPNEIFECVEDAKKKELEKFPETATFKREHRFSVT